MEFGNEMSLVKCDRDPKTISGIWFVVIQRSLGTDCFRLATPVASTDITWQPDLVLLFKHTHLSHGGSQLKGNVSQR